MAKKKSAAPESSASTKPAKPVVPAKKRSTSKAATNGDASTASSELGHDQIGFVAGDVWLYLTENGEASLATLKKEIHTTPELLCAAVGWLAREDKLAFNVNGKTVKVSLK
jgi:hypothetical protein